MKRPTEARARRLPARAGRGFGLILAGYALAAALLALVPGPRDASADPAAGTVTVLLVAGPIHYDFLLPADRTTRARFAFAEAAGVPVRHPGAAWIAVGWGARAFYTTAGTYADITPGAVLKGLTGDLSVMHLDLAGPLADPGTALHLALTPRQYTRLLDAIAAGFAADADRDPIPLAAPGFGPADAFFEARGRYDPINTCNAWIGQTLRAAGLAFGLWTPLPYSVRLSHWLWQAGG